MTTVGTLLEKYADRGFFYAINSNKDIKKMNAITLTPEIYHRLAERILDSLDLHGECDERFELNEDGFMIDASIRLVVHRKRDGEELAPISDVGFLWVEVRTLDGNYDDVPNDFKTRELKRYILGE